MLNDYSDIISRLGPPLWYDETGVPRYDPFKPSLCGVYVDMIAYMEIACQACDRRFMVTSERSHRTQDMVLPAVGTDSPGNAWNNIGSFHYGDPPRHSDCVGDTMNSVPIRVVEFWARDKFDWHRKPECEVEMPPLDEPDFGL